MKHYLLGQNAADFLKRQMANQTTEQPPVSQNAGRISGGVMPFEITGDWVKASGEDAYSCKAKQVYWNGKSYVKDDATDAFTFTLYAPQDRGETPGHAVGDTVFAVIRGNHWEVLGVGGGGLETAIHAITSVLAINHFATVTREGVAAGYISAEIMNTGRNIEIGTQVLGVSIPPVEKTTFLNGISDPQWTLLKTDVLSKFNSWVTPLIHVNSPAAPNMTIRSGLGTAVVGNVTVQGIAWKMHYETGAFRNVDTPYTVDASTYHPGIVEMYTRAGTATNGETMLASPLYRWTWAGSGAGIIVSPTAGAGLPTRNIILQLPTPLRTLPNYAMRWRRGTTGTGTVYTAPFTQATLIGNSNVDATGELQVAIDFRGTTSAWTSKGTFTNT